MYGTLAQLKREVGLSQSDTTQDDYVTDLLKAVAGWIEDETGRTFTSDPVTVTDEVYRNVTASLFLKSFDVKTVTKVELKYVTSEDYAELDSDEYDFESTGHVTLYPNTWTRSWESPRDWSTIPYVRISYTHGGSGIPAAIDRIAIETAANMYRNRGDNTTVSSEQIGDYKVSYRDVSKAGASMVDTLKTYRMFHV